MDADRVNCISSISVGVMAAGDIPKASAHWPLCEYVGFSVPIKLCTALCTKRCAFCVASASSWWSAGRRGMSCRQLVLSPKHI